MVPLEDLDQMDLLDHQDKEVLQVHLVLQEKLACLEIEVLVDLEELLAKGELQEPLD